MPVKIDKSGFEKLKKNLAQLSRSQVLVGIPQEKSGRKESPINNAALLWLHKNGSPLKHIPARPVLEPAIEKNRSLFTPNLAAAAKAVLDANPSGAEQELHRAGTIAANAAKRYVMIGSNLAPNAPSTIKRKKSARPLIDMNSMVRAITHVVREEP